MSAPGEVRALLAKHGLRAKKVMGQNFLVDDKVYAASWRPRCARPTTGWSRSVRAWAP